MKKVLFAVTLMCLIFRGAFSQPVVNIDSLERIHPPGKAALRSALLPGLGQAYNKKYWKIPIIYAGAATLTYFTIYNNDQYQSFRTAYRLRADGDSTTTDEYANTNLTESDLKTQKDYWQRNRDLCIIGIAVLYTLNVIDAYVDAQLFYFEVSDKIAFRWTPTPLYSTRKAFAGVNLQLTF